MGTKSFSVPARLQDLNRICEAVALGAEQAGFDERIGYACQLAVNEAVENIVVHGYGADLAGKIHVKVTSRQDELIVELRDSAPKFNPVEFKAKPPISPEDPPVGGLGLQILKRVMDDIKYERIDGENRLYLRKLSGD